jgi:putative glycosyltransferase (TIGR04348 family)
VTAERWARLLRELGHRATVEPAYAGGPCDLLVALHARRSARSVARSRRVAPDRPVVLALTGTDLYADLRRSRSARRALAAADVLLVLQPLARRAVPAAHRDRVVVVLQSVRPVRRAPRKARGFRVCVLGHLRPVKDPFRAALAARRLPAASRVRVVHAGAALTRAMARRARAEEARNPRWRWRGDLPRTAALRLLSGSRLAVLSSRSEGGANVIGEALVHGVPLLASRIPGSVGLLGARWPGWFPAGDTAALAARMRRAETDPRFLARLSRAGRRLAPRFSPARERRAWRDLLRRLVPERHSNSATTPAIRARARS